MKILGRILIILVVFALVMGITYVVVNAGSVSSNASAFERGDEAFPQPNPEHSQMPHAEGSEFHGEGHGGRWIVGGVRNIGVITLIVIAVLWLKNYLQTRKRLAE